MNKITLPKVKLIIYLLFVFGYTTAQVNLDSLKTELNLMVYNNPKEAIRRVDEIYPTITDPSMQISYLLTSANAYAVLKNHDAVMETALKAKKIADEKGSPVNKIQVSGFIGGQYRRLGLDDKALLYINEAEEVFKTEAIPDSLKYLGGNILIVKGLIQRSSLGCEYALPYFKEAANVYKKYISEKINMVSVAIAYNNIADCYIEMNDLDAAELNFKQAVKYSLEVNSGHSLAYAKMGLSRIYKQKNENNKAIGLLKEVDSDLDKMNDLSIKKEVYKQLSENYKAIKDTQNYEYYNQLYFEETKRIIAEEKKSLNAVVNDLSEEKQKSQKQTKSKFIFMLLGAIFVFIAIMSYMAYKIVKKKKKINEKKEQFHKER
ncbi:tetratricopeptide repeat protein [Flavobacterium sp. ST-75]|uniref:Tetratricopeptide repeat protein n=1 Tax=Flavobacterium rhizophilum TaxID=3163296 RepID=A0ABW8YH07_9FLAO